MTKRKLKIQKSIYTTLVYFFVFFATFYILLPANPVYSYHNYGIPECPDRIQKPPPYGAQLALTYYITNTRTLGGSKVLQDYFSFRGIDLGRIRDVADALRDIWNTGNEIKNKQLFSNSLQVSGTPPNHTQVSRNSKIFFMIATTSQYLDWDGDGTIDYIAKGTPILLYEVDSNQTLKKKDLKESILEERNVVYTEVYDLAYYVCWYSYQYPPLEKVYTFSRIKNFSNSDSFATTTPFINIIFNPGKPACRQWTSKGLFANTQHVECRTDALAFNGQVGNGYFYDEAKRKNILGFILVIFLGLFLGYYGAFTGAETIFYLGKVVAWGGILAAVLTTSHWATIASILENATYGTTDQPAGGLEKFSWSCSYTGQPGFCPPFSFGGGSPPPTGDSSGGGAQPECHLTAFPRETSDVPATVTFTLTATGTFEGWNGPCTLTTTIPVYLSGTPLSCSYTYNSATSASYKARLQEGPQCATYVRIAQPELTFYDFSITSLDIRTFICKNKNLDISLAQEYINRGYQFPASTTYATDFYNKVGSSTCPETQRNRPVEIIAKGACASIFTDQPCPSAKLRIEIKPSDTSLPPDEQETKKFETSSNNLKVTTSFDKPYDYTVEACFVDQNEKVINDANNLNNCAKQTLKVYDYMCLLGFCTQAQRDINNPSTLLKDLKYKILKTFKDTDAPCRFWRNEICRAQFGF